MAATLSCPVCGGSRVQLYHNRIWSLDQGAVMRCEICDLMFLQNPMNESDEATFYKDYGTHLVARGVQLHDDPTELYEKMLPAARSRLSYIETFFRPMHTVLEVGASVGSFLGVLRSHGLSAENMIAVEPSLGHREYLQSTVGIVGYASMNALPGDSRFDVVCMFHTFEHIGDPAVFLEKIRSLLLPGGVLIIEVPSHTDPLISLYNLNAFKDFYFQPMHPVIYSPKSLEYVLSVNGFVVERIIPYQRYGLDNHLGWLATHLPGGNKLYSDIIDEHTNVSYKRSLERTMRSDTIFAIARIK